MTDTPQESYSANGEEFKADKLLPCPCCGGEVKITFMGNGNGKCRKCEIKCKRCFLKRTNATIRHSHEWNAINAITDWNKRTPLI